MRWTTSGWLLTVTLCAACGAHGFKDGGEGFAGSGAARRHAGRDSGDAAPPPSDDCDKPILKLGGPVDCGDAPGDEGQPPGKPLPGEPLVSTDLTGIVGEGPAFLETRRVAGITPTFFRNGAGNSELADAAVDEECGDDPVVLAQTVAETVACVNPTLDGPGACNNDPAETQSALRGYVTGIAGRHLQVLSSSENAAWVGAQSPAFPVGWVAFCKLVRKVRLDPEQPYAFFGVTHVTFANGQPHSSVARLRYPAACANPIITTQTYQESIACGSPAGPGVCPNDVGTTSQDLKSYPAALDATGFGVFLSGMNGVWVGPSSPALAVAYHVTCNTPPAPVPADVGGGVHTGLATTAWTAGAPASQLAQVQLPAACDRAVVLTQSYVDSVACAGPVCADDPGTTSTDVQSYYRFAPGASLDLFASAINGVAASPGGAPFPLAYDVTCLR